MLRNMTAEIDDMGAGATHIGFVCSDVVRHLLLAQPKPQSYGVTATWPRVRVKTGETASEALHRCLEERIGYDEVSIYPVPNKWTTDNSTTLYFAGHTTQRGPLFNSVTGAFWHPPEDVKQFISSSNNMTSRRRDVGVLAAVKGMCLSPHRRIFLMVRELHRLGFERLRVSPGMSASGNSWRCSIVPASCISQAHGSKMGHSSLEKLEEATKKEFWAYTYGSGQQQEPFGWKDAYFDSPDHLAHKFIERQPEVAFSGWGSDLTYATWYQEMLDQTQPNGVFVSYADYALPRDFLVQMVSGEVNVTLPPPGECTR